MKKYFISLVMVAAIVACNKTTTLSSYTPAITKDFSVSSFKHSRDTVNVGDTIYLTVSGTLSDTTKSVYPYISTTTSSSIYFWGTPPASFASSKSPIKLPLTFGPATSGLYSWSSTIMLTGATMVAHKTTLTISGLFTYQLSLSTEGGGTATAPDAGQNTKTIYVR